jgi:hypothetical protein
MPCMGGGIHTKERPAAASAALRAASASAALRAASACTAAATRAASASCRDTTGGGVGRTTPPPTPPAAHDPQGTEARFNTVQGSWGAGFTTSARVFLAAVQTQASGTLRPQAIAGVHWLPALAEPKPYTPLRHEGLPPPPAHAGEPLPDGTATRRATQTTTGSVRTHAGIMHCTNHGTRARTALQPAPTHTKRTQRTHAWNARNTHRHTRTRTAHHTQRW